MTTHTAVGHTGHADQRKLRMSMLMFLRPPSSNKYQLSVLLTSAIFTYISTLFKFCSFQRHSLILHISFLLVYLLFTSSRHNIAISIFTTMWLLNCTTKMLEEHVTSPPLYAILSHTWEKDELSFADMMAVQQLIAEGHTGLTGRLPPSLTSKQGWFKIEKACDQAAADGYNHLWVDTICIDKSSSAELSEAIMSMYRWYKEADVCYVYLYDVNLDRYGPGASTRFCESRWFTRGWTLQEMIAPRRLEFYGHHWQRLGDKMERLEELVATTGVDRFTLSGYPPRRSSIARIFSWASRRTTTRIEDEAYSLIGLLDVSVVPMYGEGGRAFVRLQEILISQYEDDSIFAWWADREAYWNLPKKCSRPIRYGFE